MFSTADHWRFFAEFCRWEKASGGPDPQLAMVEEMTRSMSEQDRLWAVFCYGAVYNVPFGEVIWRQSRDSLAEWMRAAFQDKKLVTRFERRCVRRADWMEEYFSGVCRFMGDWPNLKDRCQATFPAEAYDLAWDSVTDISRAGRYIALKLIELLRRCCDLAVQTPDIRARDAWSPRKTLAVLLPDKEIEIRSNSPGVIASVEQSCREVVARLAGDFGVDLDMFDLQVLLCEYRESWEGERQYPGRSLDSELGYARKAEAFWGYKSDIWRARRELFPHEHLGEMQGWEGPRKDVAKVLAKHNYTWSDLLYSYGRTTDFASPVSQ